MKLFVVLCMVGAALAATVVDPEECTEFPCMIFEDEFDTFDFDVWEHEITMAGGGNWEFEAYVNNRSITYVRDSTMFIKPALVSEWKTSTDFLTSGVLSFHGSQGRNEDCTGAFFWGCERGGTPANPINPIMSGRLRSLGGFSFRYGTVEIRAKIPRGDWLWPAIWMMPENFQYGLWPASGEIDIMEARGNDDFGNLGNEYAGATVHWGPYFEMNRYPLTTGTYSTADKTSFADDFHVWKTEWTDSAILFYLDDVLQVTIDPGTSFWDLGDFDSDMNLDNIWKSGNKMAPFDKKFYFILNVAVGGTGGYFSDGISDSKPWSDSSSQATAEFLNDIDSWLPTWKQGEETISEGAALQIDYIRVYKMTDPDM